MIDPGKCKLRGGRLFEVSHGAFDLFCHSTLPILFQLDSLIIPQSYHTCAPLPLHIATGDTETILRLLDDILEIRDGTMDHDQVLDVEMIGIGISGQTTEDGMIGEDTIRTLETREMIEKVVEAHMSDHDHLDPLRPRDPR